MTRNRTGASGEQRDHRRVMYPSAMRDHGFGDTPNMTPMVDIMMCILIFFMASTAFLGPEWFMESAIPRQGAASAASAADPFALPPVRLTITLARAQTGEEEASEITVFSGLDDTFTPLDGFAERLGSVVKDAGSAGIDIVLEPDARVPYEDVVRAQDIAMQAGVNTVGIETRQLGQRQSEGG
ncbi:MAG: biopolymer transporter ExbD [Phycisphaeraceae bacterium]|nr:biopolymer transporter ExbD [Phycisphaerales bacterium]MCB9859926.1 biopolymer transporter ExbD [Phycisphaeraceae bacterium]